MDQYPDTVPTCFSHNISHSYTPPTSVEVDAFRDKLERKEGILIGLCCQFILLPFCGFLTVLAFNLKEVYGITLLIVTSSPGGSYSNLWCSLFNADLALSVAMTTASTVVAAIMLPFAARRPISLVRCPSGWAKKCFFQKHDSGSFGDAVHPVPIREKDGSTASNV